jgi:hypothetical protein
MADVREERRLRVVELGELLRAAALGVVGPGGRDPRGDLTGDEADERAIGVVAEEVGSSGPPWRLEVSDATSPKEDTG